MGVVSGDKSCLLVFTEIRALFDFDNVCVSKNLETVASRSEKNDIPGFQSARAFVALILRIQVYSNRSGSDEKHFLCGIDCSWQGIVNVGINKVAFCPIHNPNLMNTLVFGNEIEAVGSLPNRNENRQQSLSAVGAYVLNTRLAVRRLAEITIIHIAKLSHSIEREGAGQAKSLDSPTRFGLCQILDQSFSPLSVAN